jgi:hypothetical protein
MDDRIFLTTLNGILEKGQLVLPPLEPEAPSADTLKTWAGFLEICVRRGIRLSDPRWSRLALARSVPFTVFELHGEQATEAQDDFPVGLQLLMGLLEDGQD